MMQEVMSVVQNVDVESAVKGVIDLIGRIKSFVHPHDKVIIKPT